MINEGHHPFSTINKNGIDPSLFPNEGVLVALEDHGECVVGVVALPALGETLWAAHGGGAFVNGTPARVSSATTLAAVTISLGK